MLLYLLLFLIACVNDVMSHNHRGNLDHQHSSNHGKKESGRIHNKEHLRNTREILDKHLKSKHGVLNNEAGNHSRSKIGKLKDHSEFSVASSHLSKHLQEKKSDHLVSTFLQESMPGDNSDQNPLVSITIPDAPIAAPIWNGSSFNNESSDSSFQDFDSIPNDEVVQESVLQQKVLTIEDRISAVDLNTTTLDVDKLVEDILNDKNINKKNKIKNMLDLGNKCVNDDIVSHMLYAHLYKDSLFTSRLRKTDNFKQLLESLHDLMIDAIINN